MTTEQLAGTVKVIRWSLLGRTKPLSVSVEDEAEADVIREKLTAQEARMVAFIWPEAR